jgi:hypothetical protein
MFEELDEMSKGQNYMIMNVYLVDSKRDCQNF